MITGVLVGGAGLPAVALVPMLVAIGVGMSYTRPAMTAAVIESVPGERAGLAAGVVNGSRQVGSDQRRSVGCAGRRTSHRAQRGVAGPSGRRWRLLAGLCGDAAVDQA